MHTVTSVKAGTQTSASAAVAKEAWGALKEKSASKLSGGAELSAQGLKLESKKTNDMVRHLGRSGQAHEFGFGDLQLQKKLDLKMGFEAVAKLKHTMLSGAVSYIDGGAAMLVAASVKGIVDRILDGESAVEPVKVALTMLKASVEGGFEKTFGSEARTKMSMSGGFALSVLEVKNLSVSILKKEISLSLGHHDKQRGIEVSYKVNAKVGLGTSLDDLPSLARPVREEKVDAEVHAFFQRTCVRAAEKYLENEKSGVNQQIRAALEATFPPDFADDGLSFEAKEALIEMQTFSLAYGQARTELGKEDATQTVYTRIPEKEMRGLIAPETRF